MRNRFIGVLVVGLLVGCGGSKGGSEVECGNGIVEGSEQCDDGNTLPGDGCDPSCQEEASCGDGALDPGEACDDGNTVACDGCSPSCAIEACGDGVVECTEECDDGNSAGDDGCAASCTVEQDWSCTGEPSVCTPDVACGNGIVDSGEACDDGAANSDSVPDACRTDCTLPGCGDQVIDSGEACDGANLGGATCQSLGSPGGSLACSGSCQWNFAGCDPYWGTPTSLHNGSGFATPGRPAVVVDASGNATVVWQEETSFFFWDIYTIRYEPGVGWGSPMLLETSSESAQNPVLALDGAGNVIAVWRQNNPSNDRIWSSRFTIGAGWDAPQLIDMGAGDAGHATVAANSAGEAFAIWHETGAPNVLLLSNRYRPGIGWEGPEQVYASSSFSGWPRAGVDAAGNALVVWTQGGAQDVIWSNRYTMGVGWGVAGPLETGTTGNAAIPALAVNPAGDGVAVWSRGPVTSADVWSSRYSPGVGWGLAELVEPDAGKAEQPAVAIDATGNATVVWQYDNGGIYNVFARRHAPGTGWGAIQQLDTAGTAYFPRVGVDSAGSAVAVWRQFSGQTGSIFANFETLGSSWATAGAVESNPEHAYYPELAVGASGHVLAVWWADTATGDLELWSSWLTR